LLKVIQGRWSCLPLAFAFYLRYQTLHGRCIRVGGQALVFQTKFAQAVQMIAAVAKVFVQVPVLVVADSWFGNAGLLKPLRAELGTRAQLLSRLRVNTVLYDLPPTRTPTPGRPRKYGPRLGNPAQLAAALQGEARTYTLNLYGGVREVAAAERLVMLKTLRCQVRVVWVFRRTQWVALVTTDLDPLGRPDHRVLWGALENRGRVPRDQAGDRQRRNSDPQPGCRDQSSQFLSGRHHPHLDLRCTLGEGTAPALCHRQAHRMRDNMSQELRIGVSGMTCASCVARVERAIARQPGVDSATVNLAAQTAVVRFDQAEVPALLEAVRGAGYEPVVETATLAVRGMTCASCVARVERAITRLPGVISASVNLGTESATVEFLPDSVSRERIAQAIREAGYEADAGTAAPDQGQQRQEQELGALRRDLRFAAALTLPLVLISMGPMVLPAVGAGMHRLLPAAFWHWLELLLATPVLLWAGRRFLVQGWAELRHLAPGMNSLVAIGASAAWIYSTCWCWWLRGSSRRAPPTSTSRRQRSS
jgi:copper ion binding protein